MNRFQLDFETFQRKKINNRVKYPYILNMNTYFKKYEDIVILPEEEGAPGNAGPQPEIYNQGSNYTPIDLAPFYQDEAYDAAPDTILKKRKKRNNSFDKNSDPKFE